jgi:WD40 repeat protein/DNA-binding SARP family transcriptional activator/serine/threonine protein kinase
MIEVHALGAVTVTCDGVEVGIGGPRQRRLLAMLLIHGNTVVSVDRLAEAVFAGEPTAAASTTLRSYVARIRKVIDSSRSTANGDGPAVVTQAPGYVLRLTPDTFDVSRFEQLLAEGQTRLGRGDPVAAAAVIRQALGLWRGGAYAEFADEEWALPEAQRLEELRLVANERLIDADLACGRAAEVIPRLETLVAEHPLREPFRRQLMTALYRTGRQVDALRTYHDHREVLADELGLDPSRELAELEGRILAHDPSLLLVEPAGRPLRGYRLGERLGTGRNGTVHAGRLPGVDRDVAICTVSQALADDPDFVRTFEARVHQVASVQHPALVPIHDYWREPGSAYLVMRLMRGGTLHDRLERGGLERDEVVELVRRIGGALQVASARGVVHGAVRSNAVLYDDAGDPYLANFTLDASSRATLADDVANFAVLVGDCLRRAGSGAGETLDAVLADARSETSRPTMDELVARLLDALTNGDATTAVARPNPFKGLRAFVETDAADFFGRDGVVRELLDRLATGDPSSRLTILVGGSGGGKSSVVRAGLLPLVRRGAIPGSDRWFVTTMLPGSSPFKELAESLRQVAVVETDDLAGELSTKGGVDRVIRRLVPSEGELLLVVDQLEELFTLAGEHEQSAFLDGLLDAVEAPDSRLRMVATLRADFYDRPLAFQRFGAAVNGATLALSPMSASDLEAAIVGPVERVGGSVERALVTELVTAVVDQPAALPSLQFALYELAERRDDRVLTRDAYRELGGIDAAIALRAESLYQSHDDAGRAAVRQIFERLVVVNTESEAVTGRRTPRVDVTRGAPGRAVDDVIDRWVAARLLTLDHDPRSRVPTVQVAHEALLGAWPRLRQWLDEDRDTILVLGQLRDATTSWEGLGRDPGALYRGTRLQVALDVVGDDLELPAGERDFLDTSRRERDREAQEHADDALRQARANRRLRIQFALIAVALVVALVGGFVALQQREDAQRQRRLATARELAAASAASLADDPERSVLLALAAIDQTRSSDGTVLPEAEAALHEAVTSSRVVLNVPGVGGRLDWSPAGAVFVTEGPEESGMVDLRDTRTGASVRAWRGDDIDINEVVFSADGSLLATAGDDSATRIWNPSTGALVAEVVGDGPAWAPSFSADGSLLASVWYGEGLVRINDAGTGALITAIDVPDLNHAALSPDGRHLAVSRHDAASLVLLDARSGDEVLVFEGRDNGADIVAWSPDGTRLAATNYDRTVRIWDAATGEQQTVITTHTAGSQGIDWSADSAQLATGSDDGTVRVWDLDGAIATERLRLTAQDLRNGVPGVSFSPDGTRLVVGDWSVTSAKIFDIGVSGGSEVANLQAVPGTVNVAFAGDGRVLAATDDGALAVHDIETGAPARVIGGSQADTFETNPDGRLAAVVTGFEFPVRLYDVASGDETASIVIDGPPWVVGLAWSPDGTNLAIAQVGDDTALVTVVERTGEVVATLEEDAGFSIGSISFDRSGTRLAVTRRFNERADPARDHVKIWDWRTGEVEQILETQARYAEFDPAGGLLVTAGYLEGTADVWDVTTGDLLRSLEGHTALISDITFDRAGTRLATSSSDGTVRIWDPATGLQLQVLRGHVAGVTDSAFAHDGSRLVSIDESGLVRVWALDADELMDIASSRLTRGLTDGECRQYLRLDRCPAAG